MFRTNVFCVCLGSWRCWYFVEHPSSGRKQRWRHLRCSHCSWQLASRHCRFVQSRFEMAFSRWIKVRAKIPELLCIPVYFLKYPVQFQINPVHAAAVYPSCFVRTAYTLHVDSTRSRLLLLPGAAFELITRSISETALNIYLFLLKNEKKMRHNHDWGLILSF